MVGRTNPPLLEVDVASPDEIEGLIKAWRRLRGEIDIVKARIAEIQNEYTIEQQKLTDLRGYLAQAKSDLITALQNASIPPDPS